MALPALFRTLPILLAGLLAGALGAAPAPAAAAKPDVVRAGAPTVAGLRADGLDQPLGIEDRTPVLSWRVTSPLANSRQRAVQIQAASSRVRLLAGRPDLWSTGRRTFDGPSMTYAGKALKSRSTVYWRVRVYDDAGRVSRWSAPATFELGLLHAGDWDADWITDPAWTPERYKTVTSAPVTVRFPAVEARYLRITATELGATPATDSGHYVQLAELEAYGAASGENLAARAPVTASSTLSCCGWAAANLTDGVRTPTSGALGWTTYPSRPSTDQSADPPWVSVDLGAVRTVDRVVLYPRTDILSTTGGTASFPVDFTVATGTGTDLRTVATVTDQPTPAAPVVQNPAALPVLAGEFTAGRRITRARLYVSGVGVVIPSLNGKPVGDAVLEPGYSDVADRVGYAAYDVTDLIRPGANVVGVRLGTGIASVSQEPGRYTKFTGTQSLPKAIAQLELTDSRGRRTVVGTDASWHSAQGATVLSNFYGGEVYDARREIAGWDAPGTSRTGWDAAVVTGPPAATTALTGRQSPPLRITETLPAKLVGTPADGVRLYDLGTNMAGWMRLRITAPAGQQVSIYPAEVLSNGRINQASTGSPTFDTFIGDGTPRTWHPEFMYHGFRYFEVRGVTAGVTVTDAAGLVIRADNDQVGTFSSSDATLNAVHKMIDRAVQSNMYSVLTDCPHREKLGWLEETHLVFGTVMRNYDVAAYAQDLVRTIAEAQLPNGLVPDIAPEYTVFGGGFRDDPNWGSAIVMLPWEMYRNYGDTETLRTYYPNMRAYLSYLDTRAGGGLLRYGGSGLGDWAELLTGAARTNVDLVVNAAYYRTADALAKIAGALGDTTAASAYRAKADAIQAAFRQTWYSPATHNVANGSQASLALALDIGAVPQADRAAVFANLIAAIGAAGNHLNVGEIALPAAFRVLSGAGRDDLVHTLTVQPTRPSYGYFVANGATSLPEYWDMAGSQNHFMLGAIDEWFSARLAGIRQADDSVAYRQLIVQPAVVGGVTHAESGYRTPYGEVAVSWQVTAGKVALQASVPVGSTAKVSVPLLGATTPPAAPRGATYLGIERLADGRDYAAFTVGSGRWSFG